MYLNDLLLEFDYDDKDNVLLSSCIDLLIKNQVPFILKGFVNINEEYISSFTKANNPNMAAESIQTQLLKFLFKDNNPLKISASQNGLFSGVAEDFSQVSANIDQYLNYEGNLKLYLSQIDIKNKLENTEININTPNNKDKNNNNTYNINNNQLINYEAIRHILHRNFNIRNFDSINIWHSKKGSIISKFHYDYYENFLYIFKGEKIVYLSPYSANMIFSDIYGDNTINQANRYDKLKLSVLFFRKLKKIKKLNFQRIANHLKNTIYNLIKLAKEKLSTEKVHKCLENNNKVLLSKLVSEKLSKNDSLNSALESLINKYSDLIQNQIGKSFILAAELKEGQIIYIPEGYWHKVKTNGADNLAFNFWWNNFNRIISLNKEIFTIKSSLYSLVDKYIKQKGKHLLISETDYLKNFQELILQDKEKQLIYFLFGEKYRLDKFILLYYCFENFTHFEAPEGDTKQSAISQSFDFIIKKLWFILNKHKKQHMMFKQFEHMRKLVARKIIKEEILQSK